MDIKFMKQMYPAIDTISLIDGLNIILKPKFRFYAMDLGESKARLSFYESVFLPDYQVKKLYGVDRKGQPKYVDALMSLMVGTEFMQDGRYAFVTGYCVEQSKTNHILVSPDSIVSLADDAISVEDAYATIIEVNKKWKAKPSRAPRAEFSQGAAGKGITGTKKRKTKRK